MLHCHNNILGTLVMKGAAVDFHRAYSVGLRCLAIGLGCMAGAGHALASERSVAVFDQGYRPLATFNWNSGQPAVRQRVAKVDFERLGDIRHRVSEGHVAQMTLNLWPDAEFDALLARTARTSAGYSLSGRLAGIPNGATTLVVNGDVVAGTVWTPTTSVR